MIVLIISRLQDAEKIAEHFEERNSTIPLPHIALKRVVPLVENICLFLFEIIIDHTKDTHWSKQISAGKWLEIYGKYRNLHVEASQLHAQANLALPLSSNVNSSRENASRLAKEVHAVVRQISHLNLPPAAAEEHVVCLGVAAAQILASLEPALPHLSLTPRQEECLESVRHLRRELAPQS